MSLFVAELDETTAGHLAVAVALLRRWLRDQGVSTPEEIIRLEAVFRSASSSATSRPRTTDLGEPAAVPDAPSVSPILFTSDQAAAFLNVSTRTVQRFVTRGELATIDVGGRGPRFHRDDLEAFIERRRVEGAA